MLLLIIPENGAHCKTYGRESLNLANMICPFWCFVIVLICSYRASADMDLYPDSKYNLANAQFLDYDNAPLASKKWRNTNISPVQHESSNFKQSLEPEYEYGAPVEEKEAAQKNSLDGILQFLRKHSRGVDTTIRNYPQFHRQLPQIRPYGDADDYTDEENDRMEQKWFNDEIERNTEQILRKLQKSSRKKIVDYLKSINNDETAETTKAYEHDQRNEETANFAFVPPDPRYYETQSKTISAQESQPDIETISHDNIKPIHHNVSDGTNMQKTIEIPFRRDHTDISSTKKYFRHDPPSDFGDVVVKPNKDKNDITGVYIIAIVAGISAAATVGLIAIGIGWYK
ncbi:hypothetical protein WA026_020911 [Henosepilachna vigintioctopunctata]|uniref:Uncharacterized protein n=1 Tax=Henosepilachna vigintioctopunctata TaxID=420089 RepID=A0AAW1UMG8_9CUCU